MGFKAGNAFKIPQPEEAEGGSGIKIVSSVASKQAPYTVALFVVCTVLGEIQFLSWVSDTTTSLRGTFFWWSDTPEARGCQWTFYWGRGRLSFQATYNGLKTKSFLSFVSITTPIALMIVIIMAIIMTQ